MMLPLVPSYRHYDLVAMIRMLTRTRCVCIRIIFYRDMMHLIDSDACVLDCDKPTHTNMRLYVVNRSMFYVCGDPEAFHDSYHTGATGSVQEKNA